MFARAACRNAGNLPPLPGIYPDYLAPIVRSHDRGNAEIGAVHQKAMPVILTEADQIDAWLSAPWPRRVGCSGHTGGSLQAVARGEREDADIPA